jgi:hypothetical protein
MFDGRLIYSRGAFIHRHSLVLSTYLVAWGASGSQGVVPQGVMRRGHSGPTPCHGYAWEIIY